MVSVIKSEPAGNNDVGLIIGGIVSFALMSGPAN